VSVAASNFEAIGRDEVAALVITYFPDAGLPARLDSLLAQFDRVALVDNGSPDENLTAVAAQVDRSAVSLHRNSTNLGIATALNQGMRILADEGFRWVVTLDQDSEVQSGFLSSMLEMLNSRPDQVKIALIGSNRIDPDSDVSHRWLRPSNSFPFFQRVNCERASKGVTLVITSGTLTNVAAFVDLGGFRDELFIDLVDFEYCLRARQQGYKILVSCDADLKHMVGIQTHLQAAGITLSQTHHSPLRRYYLFRNSIYLIKRYAFVHPHWVVYHLLAMGEVILGIVVSETDRRKKLHACLLGIFDGLARKTGPALDGAIS
jgi:rhamnosyltransferase